MSTYYMGLTNFQTTVRFLAHPVHCNILYDYQFVSLYSMNFMLHTMLDTSGDVLKSAYET